MREVVVEIDLNLRDVHLRVDSAIRLAAKAAVLGKLERRPHRPSPHCGSTHDVVTTLSIQFSTSFLLPIVLATGMIALVSVDVSEYASQPCAAKEDAEVEGDKHQEGEERYVVRPAVVLLRGAWAGIVGQRGSENDGEDGGWVSRLGLEADFKDPKHWRGVLSRANVTDSEAVRWAGIFFGSSRGEGWSGAGSRWVGRGGRRVLTFFLYFA